MASIQGIFAALAFGYGPYYEHACSKPRGMRNTQAALFIVSVSFTILGLCPTCFTMNLFVISHIALARMQVAFPFTSLMALTLLRRARPDATFACAAIDALQ